ncbi:DUF4232 domain-containing protein [Streptomyces candidus]|uniref:DUF4232 domain-containing protein n=1 Tax=Streptomyces candidus TaxID=67283 RepID=A0A7X0HIH7_9ACTN|nr:DUF4232 domain-containing protein [Streptomyces candidus]MBB6436778.1 hypothetical protein [Streptomyces candidus]
MRTSIRRPAVLAATAFAALSLTLTACSDGTGARSEESKAPSSAAKASAASPEAEDKAAGEPADAGKDAGAAGPANGTAGTTGTQTGTTSPKKTGGKAPACTVNDVRITAAKEGVPTTRITLTAKNTSGRACTMVKYPLLAFGGIQTAKDVPAVAKSQPGVPVVLEPGAPAYAAVHINNGGVDEKNRAVTSFYVNLFATDGPAEGSRTITVPGGIAVDDAVAKTGYWTPQLRNGADEF